MGKVINSLDSLHPIFKAKLLKLLNDAKAEKINVVVFETLRTFERQAELHAQGRTKPGPIVTNAKPGESRHHWGMAADIYPLDDDGKIVWNFDQVPKYMAWMKRLAQIAEIRGITWGGHWKFKDMPHFQDKTMPSLAECRAKWPKGWIPGVSKV